MIQEKKEKIAQQKAANKEGTTNDSIEEGELYVTAILHNIIN